jgi:hypothetical protein
MAEWGEAVLDGVASAPARDQARRTQCREVFAGMWRTGGAAGSAGSQVARGMRSKNAGARMMPRPSRYRSPLVAAADGVGTSRTGVSTGSEGEGSPRVRRCRRPGTSVRTRRCGQGSTDHPRRRQGLRTHRRNHGPARRNSGRLSQDQPDRSARLRRRRQAAADVVDVALGVPSSRRYTKKVCRMVSSTWSQPFPTPGARCRWFVNGEIWLGYGDAVAGLAWWRRSGARAVRAKGGAHPALKFVWPLWILLSACACGPQACSGGVRHEGHSGRRPAR